MFIMFNQRYSNTMNSHSELLQRITVDPAICHGKPAIRGLRYPVETILELLAAGMTHDEILADYPDLEQQDILACLAFATVMARSNGIYRMRA
jgi:uncharacterized protein (DUF433 family)